MAHDKTKTLIANHKFEFARAIIQTVGPQMGLDNKSCSSSSRRKDSVIFAKEQTIRYIGDHDNRFGQNVPRHFINDGVLYICPGQWGLNDTPSQLKTFTVGIEIKEDRQDLRRDTKIQYYLGWTDFYIILVPDNLRSDAFEKIKELDDARFGLVTYSPSGHFRIVRVPQRQQVLAINQHALALQALFSQNNLFAAEIFIDPNETGTYIEADAYSMKFRNIHFEFEGREDTYIRNKE